MTQCKVNVCKIVERLGQLLSQEDKDKLVDLNVVESLQKAARHRVIQVQMAASRALKSWKGIVPDSPQAGLSVTLSTYSHWRPKEIVQRGSAPVQRMQAHGRRRKGSAWNQN